MTTLLLDAALVLSVVLVAVGAGLIYMPAGLIVGGLLGIALVLASAGVLGPRAPREVPAP